MLYICHPGGSSTLAACHCTALDCEYYHGELHRVTRHGIQVYVISVAGRSDTTTFAADRTRTFAVSASWFAKSIQSSRRANEKPQEIKAKGGLPPQFFAASTIHAETMPPPRSTTDQAQSVRHLTHPPAPPLAVRPSTRPPRLRQNSPPAPTSSPRIRPT